jgi:hypothetical protein
LKSKICLINFYFRIDQQLLSLINNVRNNNTNDNDEADSKLIKDLQKRLSELEKFFKILSGTINIDLINKEIIAINEKLENKVGQAEFKELKDNSSNYI